MTTYNLIRNSYFTASGTQSFTWSDLNLLYDSVTTSGGISITGSNEFIVDLNQRIKVDNIKLYASDLTKASNIKFWYKDYESGVYALTPTYVDSYYYTFIPTPSAPQYIKVTISGVSMDLYEFQIFNDDYIVAFGEDGYQTIEYLTAL